MNSYLINCGDIFAVIFPDNRQYYLFNRERHADTLRQYLNGEAVDFSGMQARWFRYSTDEHWHNFLGDEFAFDKDVDEKNIIEFFTLKKYNFGSLVAIRTEADLSIKKFKNII